MNGKASVERALCAFGAMVLKGTFPLGLIRKYHLSCHFAAGY
jgi:hypothetical protein